MINKDDWKIIKNIILLFKPYSLKLTAVFIFILFSSFLNIILPIISKNIIDKGLMVNNFNIVVQYTIWSMIIVFIIEGLGFFEIKFRTYITSMLELSLKKKSLNHLLDLKISYFNDKNSSEIINKIEIDIGNICFSSNNHFFFIILNILKIIGGAIGLLYISWKLTILVIAFLPIRYLFVVILSKKRRSIFEKYLDLQNDYYGWYADRLTGIKEIKLWGFQNKTRLQFINFQRKLIKINFKHVIINKLNELSESFLFNLITNFIYIIGAYFIIFNHSFTIGGLFAFTAYSCYVTMPISAIFNLRFEMASLLPSAKRLFHFFEMDKEYIYEKKILKQYPSDLKGNIFFENVSFSYSQQQDILKNIHFSINEKDKVALFGSNGSGKTTIFNLLLKFYSPTKGRIVIDNENIELIDIKKLRKMISMISQDLYLFNTTIKENIELNNNLSELELDLITNKSGIYDFVKSLPTGYETTVGYNGAHISGGQRQKIAISRAFVHKSKIMLFDEATSNFDLASEIQFYNNILNHYAKHTIIIITHKPEILQLVDKVLFLNEGQLVDYGKHHWLYNNNMQYRYILDEYDLKLKK